MITLCHNPGPCHSCPGATLSAGSRSLSLRLSQHHHNEQWSPWSWGGGNVCRDNRGGKIFYRRPSQDSAAGRKWETISGWQSQSESLSPWGSWGAVRRTIQWDENCCAAAWRMGQAFNKWKLKAPNARVRGGTVMGSGRGHTRIGHVKFLHEKQ